MGAIIVVLPILLFKFTAHCFSCFFAWQKKQPNVRLLAILEKKKFLKLSSALCVDLAISRTFLSSDAILVGWLDLFLSFVKAKNEEH